MSHIEISQLWIYPIKSLPGISLPEVALTRKGFAHDRYWMLVDTQNQFISQRQFPVLSQIRLSLDNQQIQLRYSGSTDLQIPLELPQGTPIQVSIWQDKCDAWHYHQDADQWFSRIIGQPCKLVFMPPQSQRVVDPNYAKHQELTTFTDGFPLLLISQASLDDLNTRLHAPISMRRFRPNIVVTGCAPYAEDEWQFFDRGNLRFRVVKPCSRCIIPTIDPDTGEKSSLEPLATLSTYRKQGNKVYFGQNLLFDTTKVAQKPEFLSVHDQILPKI